MRQLLHNSLALRIFLLVLSAGLLGIGGMILLNMNIEELSRNYESIAADCYENKEYMDSIRAMLYQDQALVFNHIRSQSLEEMTRYEIEEERIAIRIRYAVREFDENLTDENKREVFHSFYSNTFSYLSTVNNVLSLSRNGEKNTADYYVSAKMDASIESINQSITNLKIIIDTELEALKNNMEQSLQATGKNVWLCVIAMVCVLTPVLFLCAGMTSDLEHYKARLEKDLEEKSNELLAHNRKLMEMQDNTIIAMANLIESRDGETGLHVKRTSAYVRLIAERAKARGLYRETITDDYVELLVKAAPLHDIGKIAVPDHILQKPGRLTAEEFEVMKTHAPKGGEIILDVLGNVEEKEYVNIARDVAAYHHERWDGNGYPEGKTGESIPVCARIMALADVFDALVSERCYKKAYPFDKAMQIMKEEAGSHFDPALTALFLENPEALKRIMETS